MINKILHLYLMVIIVLGMTGPLTAFAADNDSVDVNLQVSGTPSIIIYDVNTSDIATTSATVNWLTDVGGQCQLYWGTTTSYEMGSISEVGYEMTHTIDLSPLTSATTYHYKIRCVSASSAVDETADATFATLSEAEQPDNPTCVEITVDENGNTIWWCAPSDPSILGIKIARSNQFYPATACTAGSGVTDCQIIYDGQGTSLNDRQYYLDGDVQACTRYYYTIFAYSSSNISSGAIATAVSAGTCPGGITPAALPAVPTETPKAISLAGLIFIEEGDTLYFVGNNLQVNAGHLMEVFVDYDRIPAGTSLLMISFTKESRTYAYIFKRNDGLGGFEASFMAPTETGEYEMSVSALDANQNIIAQINGNLIVVQPPEVSGVVAEMPINWGLIVFVTIASLLTIGLVVLTIRYRKI